MRSPAKLGKIILCFRIAYKHVVQALVVATERVVLKNVKKSGVTVIESTALQVKHQNTDINMLQQLSKAPRIIRLFAQLFSRIFFHCACLQDNLRKTMNAQTD